MLNKYSPLLFSLILALGLTSVTATAWSDFSGKWSGSWSSFYGTSGRIQTIIIQSGSDINGTLDIFATDCGNLYGLPLSGTVYGNTANFYTYVNCGGSYNELRFTSGTLSGDTITGDYTTLSDYVEYDSGRFRLDRECCTITATADTGGTISPDGIVTLAPGEQQTFIITPDPGYLIADVKVNNNPLGTVTSYTFDSVDSNSDIFASFTKLGKPVTLPFMPIMLEE